MLACKFVCHPCAENHIGICSYHRNREQVCFVNAWALGCLIILLDYFTSSEGVVTLVVSSHKTSKWLGTHHVQLSSVLSELFLLWVDKCRPWAVKCWPSDNGNVFVQKNSPNAFTSATFSRYFSKSALEITGEHINLQTIRRIFATGLLPTLEYWDYPPS